MIICENNYCIYKQKKECLLESINVTVNGQCEECLIPIIEEETLERYKSEVRKRIEQRKTTKKQQKKEDSK